MARKQRPPRALWTCPRCGAKFVSANMSHSCGRFSLDDLFARSDSSVREVFERLRAAVHACGPVIMIPQKTRLVFMNRMRFAHVMTGKSHLRVGLVLRRRLPPHACLVRVDDFGPNSLVHTFRIDRPQQVDRRLRGWIREAYVRGSQAHLLA